MRMVMVAAMVVVRRCYYATAASRRCGLDAMARSTPVRSDSSAQANGGLLIQQRYHAKRIVTVAASSREQSQYVSPLLDPAPISTPVMLLNPVSMLVWPVVSQ
ncbi:Hypothetical predicted protein [Olea europaea subsp. europaea]|uniref:Uncharacterized protein n=1 Tax=Olea europaea subsp. europaea TaxID=158383 RepID=A0A8S0R5D1_OLEEU|nr:Hypothetical predicted protein [Olea europaea subsp. europaea]